MNKQQMITIFLLTFSSGAQAASRVQKVDVKPLARSHQVTFHLSNFVEPTYDVSEGRLVLDFPGVKLGTVSRHAHKLKRSVPAVKQVKVAKREGGGARLMLGFAGDRQVHVNVNSFQDPDSIVLDITPERDLIKALRRPGSGSFRSVRQTSTGDLGVDLLEVSACFSA